MRIRASWVTLGLFLASLGPAAASSFLDAAQRLDGEWQGEGFALKVDSYRAQANVEMDKPFRWQRFLVKEVDDEKVTFAVGAELFEATVEDDRLTLTSTSFRGERRLSRRQPSAATPRATNALGLRLSAD